jgi:hypothetical protein
MQTNNPHLPCLLLDVKLLHLGCRGSACGLSRVPVVVAFYRSFGSQSTVYCKSHCIRMPRIGTKLKGGKIFSIVVYKLDRLFAVLVPLPFLSSLPVFRWCSWSSHLCCGDCSSSNFYICAQQWYWHCACRNENCLLHYQLSLLLKMVISFHIASHRTVTTTT